MIRNIIYDLDDTLLICGPHYEACRKKFALWKAGCTGAELSPDFCESILQGIDKSCHSLRGGFGDERFPRSFQAASLALDVIAKKPINIEQSEYAHSIGNAVFKAEYKLFDGVYEMLEAYEKAGIQQFILTKGADWVQMKKMHDNKLYKYIFPPNHVYIDVVKTKEHIEAIVSEHSLDKSETVMVGDNLYDDIQSALDAGIGAIWVRGNADISRMAPSGFYQAVWQVTNLPTIIPLPVSV